MKTISFLSCLALLVSACESKAQSKSSQESKISGNTLQIQVAPEAEGQYKRKNWLPNWGDADGNGINTRHEVLIRQSSETVEMSPDGSKVRRGSWYCPYTNITYHDPRKVDIDHVVPLKEVSESGGWKWDAQTQNEFANGADTLELLAVQGDANKDKSDQDPAQWMPSNRAYHCAYLERWSLIKARHGLSMDPAEFNFIQAKLNTCFSQKQSKYKITALP